MQVPIGLEDDFKGLIDLVQSKAYYFHGSNGSVFKDVWLGMIGKFALPGSYSFLAFAVRRLSQKIFLLIWKQLLLRSGES